jgi:hypothetical protein
MTGWFRLVDRRRHHLFAPMESNAFLLVPECKRPLMIGRQYEDRLKKLSDLPPGALLCQGCSASPKAAM